MQILKSQKLGNLYLTRRSSNTAGDKLQRSLITNTTTASSRMRTHMPYVSSKTAVEGASCFSALPCTSFYQSSMHHKRNDDPELSGMLAERLNELSLEEREQIFDEIHGVSKEVQEEENSVSAALKSLEEEIQKISGPNRSAYDRAVNMDPGYVQNKTFELMFLRADDFDVKKAATRLINHFKYKSDLFGNQKLVKDITYDDLSSEDQASLHTGCCQYLGDGDVIRDVKGRAVIFQFPGIIRDCDWMHICRAKWYQHMVELKNEMTQRNGFVVIIFFARSTKLATRRLNTQQVITEGLPLKVVCSHLCFIDLKITPLMRPMLNFLGKQIQTRVRIHLEESCTSCLYALQSFGIHSETVPLGYDGRPKTGMFFARLEEYKRLERQCRNGTVKIVPDSHVSDTTLCDALIPDRRDLLLGRGLKHSGNFALDILINKGVVSFKQAPSQFEKTCIVLGTVKQVQASGGRFLKLVSNSGYWFVVDDEEACRSVSTRFRNKARKLT